MWSVEEIKGKVKWFFKDYLPMRHPDNWNSEDCKHLEDVEPAVIATPFVVEELNHHTLYLDMLTKSQREVYNMVCEHPYATARELGMLYCPDDWKRPGRRMRELVKIGVVLDTGKRACHHTGFLVSTYAPMKHVNTQELTVRTQEGWLATTDPFFSTSLPQIEEYPLFIDKGNRNG